MGTHTKNASRKAKAGATSSPSRTPADWMIWGAIVKLLQEHSPDGIREECLERLLRGLLGHGISRDRLSQAVSSLFPMVSRRDGVFYLSNGYGASGFIGARRGVSTAAKRAVAIYVHKYRLKRLDTILLDSGSACESIAHEMAVGDKGHFTVLTNNMGAMREFMANRTIRLHLTGGYYRADDEALIGSRAARSLADFFVRCAIVGVSGITPTHVYCHGIEGEEELKKAFWKTSTEVLLVPATLDKIGMMDATCFGQLCMASPDLPPKRQPKAATLDEIAQLSVDRMRQQDYERRMRDVPQSQRVDVPKFKAKRCEIIIEPEWMINEAYSDRPARKQELLDMVAMVNDASGMTKVTVVHADVKKDDLS